MPKLPTGIYKKKLKNGNRYEARIDFKGKKYTVPGGLFKTLKEAKEARTTFYKELINGYIEPSKITLKEFIETVYFPDFGNIKLKYNTRIKKISKLKNYIYPTVGDIRLKRFSDNDISRFQRRLLSKTTVKNTRKIMIELRSYLNYAVKRHLISYNPAHDIDLPEVETDERIVLDKEQVVTLMKNASVREKAIIGLSLFRGLRTGEIFGLKWNDINFKNKPLVTAYIHRQYTDGIIVERVKSKKSRKVVQLGPILTEIIQDWRALSIFKNEYGWIFEGKGPGKPLHPATWTNKTFKKLLIGNDLPVIRLHDCRHTYITHGLRAGLPVPDIQDMARHEDFQTTVNIYGHEIKGHLDNSVIALERLFVESDVENVEIK